METNTAVSSGFGSVFAKRTSRFILDLSNSSLIEVMQAYATHKRKTSPKFTNQALCGNLRAIQDSCLQVIQPEDVNDEFYSCFIQWGTSKGLKLSSIKAYCGSIKTALAWASKHGCRTSESFEDINLRTNEPHRIALTPDDISHIAHFDCSKIQRRSDYRKTMEKVRDTFVLQTNLFCRYSDVSKIAPSNFEGNIFTCVQQKTGGKARVDIMRYSITPKLCMAILKKYGFTCPYTGGIDNYNKYLHELLEHIGGTFDEEVTFEDKINGRIVKSTFKKRELISSHCSRRTAITEAIKHARTETEVRRCSGHVCTGRDSFRRYIVFDD